MQDGVPLYDAQQLLGHEDYATTQRYAHLAPDAHGKVIDSWARRPGIVTQLVTQYVEKATREDRKWPVTWVGVAGFEPAASSSPN